MQIDTTRTQPSQPAQNRSAIESGLAGRTQHRRCETTSHTRHSQQQQQTSHCTHERSDSHHTPYTQPRRIPLSSLRSLPLSSLSSHSFTALLAHLALQHRSHLQ